MSASRQRKLREEKNTAAAEKKQQAITEAAKAAKRLKLWTIVFYVVIAAMLVGVIVAAVANSGILQRTLTAVKVGNHSLSAAEVNYYYMNAISSETYLPYLVDNTKPLDQQEYSDTQTWADMMMDTAIQNASAVYAVYDEAMAKGYKLDDAAKAALDQEVQSLDIYAATYGYTSASALLRANYGKGCNTSNYRDFLTVQAIANGYRNQVIGELEVTPAEIDEEFNTNLTDYTSYTIRYATFSNSKYYAEASGEHTEEETAKANEDAKNAAELVANAGKTGEDNFVSAVALQNGTKVEDDNTLRTGLKSALPSALTEWVTDEGRVDGDTAVIPMANDTGYYAVMFLSSTDNTDVNLVNVRHILIQTSDTVTSEDALAEINKIKTSYDADPSEEHFIELANEYSQDGGSNTNGGLYEGVYPGQMVTPFNDWCFDGARQPGDVDVVETSYGYHLMYFVGTDEECYRDVLVEEAIMERKFTEWFTALTADIPTDHGMGYGLVRTDVTVPAPSTSAY